MRVSVQVGLTVNLNAETREFARVHVEFNDLDPEVDLETQLSSASETAKQALDRAVTVVVAKVEEMV